MRLRATRGQDIVHPFISWVQKNRQHCLLFNMMKKPVLPDRYCNPSPSAFTKVLKSSQEGIKNRFVVVIFYEFMNRRSSSSLSSHAHIQSAVDFFYMHSCTQYSLHMWWFFFKLRYYRGPMLWLLIPGIHNQQFSRTWIYQELKRKIWGRR